MRESMSELSYTVQHLNPGGAFYCRSELRAPWGVAMPELPGIMMFHIVLEGRCWLKSKGAWGPAGTG